MKETLDRSVWTNYFADFTRKNQARTSRLELFGEYGAQQEERGMPFAGICLDQKDGDPCIEIMFGVEGSAEHLTRMIPKVGHITPKRGPDGRDEALEIVGAHGEISLLRFEPPPGLLPRNESTAE